jgi:hypothetical protein
VVPHQQLEKFLYIQAISLPPPGPTAYLDTGRIDNEIVNAHGGQVTVEPETVSTCLVAALDLGTIRQTEALLGHSNLLPKDRQISSSDCPTPRTLPESNVEA